MDFKEYLKESMNDDKFVVVGKRTSGKSKGWLTVISKPASEKEAKKNFKTLTGGLPREEVGEIMKVSDVRKNKKVFGKELLDK